VERFGDKDDMRMIVVVYQILSLVVVFPKIVTGHPVFVLALVKQGRVQNHRNKKRN